MAIAKDQITEGTYRPRSNIGTEEEYQETVLVGDVLVLRSWMFCF